MSLSLADGRQPLQSTITVNLAVRGSSNFYIQSDNPIWVNGSAAELDAFFARYANPFVVFIQRHGLNLNTVLLISAVAVLPEMPLLSRLALLAAAVMLIIIISLCAYIGTSMRPRFISIRVCHAAFLRRQSRRSSLP